MREDGERWDARYAGRSTGAPRVPEGLEAIDGVGTPAAGARCLDVACGLGEQSLWAAQAGYAVTALDASATAIEQLRAAAAGHGLDGRIDARQVDLDAGLPAGADRGFDLVICQRFRDQRLYPQLVDALAPGGLLVITVLSEVGTPEPGPFHAPAGELTRAFADAPLDVLVDREGDGAATLVGRRRGDA